MGSRAVRRHLIVVIWIFLAIFGNSFAIPVRNVKRSQDEYGSSGRNGVGNSEILDYEYQGQPQFFSGSVTLDPYLETVYGLSAKSVLYSSAAQAMAQELMISNQELMSDPGKTPLFKQSYPGLYSKAELKEYGFEPTRPVAHPFSHHGKEGHLFLQQSYPQTPGQQYRAVTNQNNNYQI